jgi:hypothetical protein
MHCFRAEGFDGGLRHRTTELPPVTNPPPPEYVRARQFLSHSSSIYDTRVRQHLTTFERLKGSSDSSMQGAIVASESTSSIPKLPPIGRTSHAPLQQGSVAELPWQRYKKPEPYRRRSSLSLLAPVYFDMLPGDPYNTRRHGPALPVKQLKSCAVSRPGSSYVPKPPVMPPSVSGLLGRPKLSEYWQPNSCVDLLTTKSRPRLSQKQAKYVATDPVASAVLDRPKLSESWMPDSCVDPLLTKSRPRLSQKQARYVAIDPVASAVAHFTGRRDPLSLQVPTLPRLHPRRPTLPRLDPRHAQKIYDVIEEGKLKLKPFNVQKKVLQRFLNS